MAFRGLITPGKPSLYPGLPSGSALRSSSGKSKSGNSSKDDSPNGMVQQTTDFNRAEAILNQERVQASNAMFNLLKHKYHGNTQAFIRDPNVQGMMRNIQNSKASLAAVRNQVESEKGYKEAAVLKTQEHNGMDKYAVDSRGNRMVMGLDGKSYAEGSTYTTPDGKKHKATLHKDQDYLKYSEMYKTDERHMRVDRAKDGTYNLDQREWMTSIDYNKDHLVDYAQKNKNLAGSTGWAGGTSFSKFNESYVKINGGGKSDVNKINMLTKQMTDAVPSEVKTQLNQEYWEKGYDRGVDLVKGNNGSSFISKQYTDGVAAGKSAKDLNISDKTYKFIKNGTIIKDENAKKNFYTTSRINDTMQATTTVDYDSPKFLKLTDAEVGFNLEKKKLTYELGMVNIAELDMLHNGHKPTNQESLFQPNGDGTYTRYKASFGNAVDKVGRQASDQMYNKEIKEQFTDDGEIDFDAYENNGQHLAIASQAGAMVFNGQVWTGEVLKHAYIYSRGNQVRSGAAIKDGTNQFDLKKSGKVDANGEPIYVGASSSAYRTYVVTMRKTDAEKYMGKDFVAQRTEGQSGLASNKIKGGTDLDPEDWANTSEIGIDFSMRNAVTFTVQLPINENVESLDNDITGKADANNAESSYMMRNSSEAIRLQKIANNKKIANL